MNKCQEKEAEVRKKLQERKIPDPLMVNGERITDQEEWERRRPEIRKMICQEMYGYTPFRQWKTEGEVVKTEENGYGGKARIDTIELKISTKKGVAVFLFELAVPKDKSVSPAFIHITGFPCDGMSEELIDNGYACASVYYQDIMPDRPEAVIEGVGRIIEVLPQIGWGKVSMWAFGISRIMDYLETRKDIDHARVAIAGHSRLGKATLLCGALDERFSLTISAGSGAGGAALFRGKVGEQIENLSKHWFCGNMQKYAYHSEELPFDQHFLLALIAPNRVYISSASDDEWADPESEFLSCVAASEVYEFLGKEGLCQKYYPETGEVFQDGYIAYHRRLGTHAMNRQDWHLYMQYRKRWNV